MAISVLNSNSGACISNSENSEIRLNRDEGEEIVRNRVVQVFELVRFEKR